MIVLYAYLLINIIVTISVIIDWSKRSGKWEYKCIMSYFLSCIITLLAGLFVFLLPFVDSHE